MTTSLLALSDMRWTLSGFYDVTEFVYLASLLVLAYFYTRHVDLVSPRRPSNERTTDPAILLLYPVLHEAEETMRTTFLALDNVDYPRDRYRIVAVPNDSDYDTIAALNRLQTEFAWLEVVAVPPTTDVSWEPVWRSWTENPKSYWWHVGKRAGVRDLPPKKTRQLIYAFYNLCGPDDEDTLISYIDADSAPPPNYFLLGADGAEDFDVVQLTNIAGNLLTTWASSFHSFDHICWDGSLYAHMSARGKHPFYVLGKGLFFHSRDLHAYGGFHPWLTIEDPEVGMRLWTNGCRLGVVEQPLVEEVPRTFRQGVTQRKRWVCGFFQSLGAPLTLMGMTVTQRWRARLNLVPCVSLLINPIGVIVGLWILTLTLQGDRPVDPLMVAVSSVNIVGAAAVLGWNWSKAWQLSAAVLPSRQARLRYVLRVNPLFTLFYWLFWSVPLIIGIQMFLRDKGLVWERTEKVDANHDLVRRLEQPDSAGDDDPVGPVRLPELVGLPPLAESPLAESPLVESPLVESPLVESQPGEPQPIDAQFVESGLTVPAEWAARYNFPR